LLAGAMRVKAGGAVMRCRRYPLILRDNRLTRNY